MSFRQFLDRWTSPNDRPVRVDAADLQLVERKLGFSFPSDYREFVLGIGLPRTNIELLNTIVDRSLDIHAIGDFFTPSEIYHETRGWREIGMPQHLVAFASDGCGNKFCFTDDGGGSVWFYDHDFETFESAAPSFADWIEFYVKI